MYSDATISADGLYRYVLYRVWDHTLPLLGYVMLNPSTADHMVDDPTVRECIRIARHVKYGGIHVCNLFAFRATKSKDMMAALDPVGPENNLHLCSLARKVNVIVLAWGGKGGYKGRDKEVIELLKMHSDRCTLMHLGKTHSGQPVHPLGSVGPVKLIHWEK